MVGKLILVYVLSLVDGAIMLCFFNNNRYMNLYHLPRAWMNDYGRFLLAKVVLVAVLLFCMYDALISGRCTAIHFNIKVWTSIFVYAFLIVYDITILIIGGAI